MQKVGLEELRGNSETLTQKQNIKLLSGPTLGFLLAELGVKSKVSKRNKFCY